MDLKKTLVFVFLVTSFNVYSIVPNNKYYELADKQIIQLNFELNTIDSSLKLNPSNETALKLKSNLEQEIKFIKQRVKLYEKLESSGIIMYSNNPSLVPKTPNKKINKD